MTATMNVNASELPDLRNIGPTLAARLEQIGLYTRADMAAMGSTVIYRRLSEQYADRQLPVCYYLYSIEGALQNRHWNDFSEQEKAQLRKSAGLR